VDNLMLIKVPGETIYFKDYGWHSGRFHFSFADYEDPEKMQFGVLRALNEFVLQPGTGFETHPHAEMEIISYCVEGELTHGDSLGNTSKLSGGSAQYLCAGSGITLLEMNDSVDRILLFYQIWITPREVGLTPKYCSIHHEQQSTASNLRVLPRVIIAKMVSSSPRKQIFMLQKFPLGNHWLL
jgi:redox-sensitive bicupin YhaK (pirin superfamily)